jgi:hypothetical protein
MKKVSLEFVSVLSTGLGLLFLLSTIQVSAQPLVTDGGNISINPGEPLPDNGTVSISTEGATDTDMNAFPPEEVTVIISRDTVTVTNQAVDIATAEGEDEDNGGGGDGNGNGNGGGDTGDGSQLPLPGFGSGEGSGSNIGSNGASEGGQGEADAATDGDGGGSEEPED